MAQKAIGTGVTATVVASAVLMAVFYPLKIRILFLFGASGNSIGYAVEYFNIILAFFSLFMLANMINAVIRAGGSPFRSMASMLAGALLNIVLDPIFIFGFKWGMAGAAAATVIGQSVSFGISAQYFFHTKTFRLKMKDLIPDLRAFSAALRLGASSFITQMTIVIRLLPLRFGIERNPVCRALCGFYSHDRGRGADNSLFQKSRQRKSNGFGKVCHYPALDGAAGKARLKVAAGSFAPALTWGGGAVKCKLWRARYFPEHKKTPPAAVFSATGGVF